MEDFRADILQPNAKGKVLFFSLILVLAVVIIILLILGIMPVVAPIFWIAIFIYGVSKYFFQTRKQVLKKSIGEFIISDDRIIALNETYSINKLQSIRIDFYGWKSYKRSEDRSVPITDMHAGDKNFISFNYHSEQKKFELLITSIEQWQLFRTHIIEWYRKGINISESVQGMKSYGLGVLNYAQIQEFKKLISNPPIKS